MTERWGNFIPISPDAASAIVQPMWCWGSTAATDMMVMPPRKFSTYANKNKCSSRQTHNLKDSDTQPCDDKSGNTYTVYWYWNSRSSQKGWDGYKYIITGRIVQRYASTVETMCHWRSYHTARQGAPWMNSPNHIQYTRYVQRRRFSYVIIDWIGHPLKFHQLFKRCFFRDTLSLAVDVQHIQCRCWFCTWHIYEHCGHNSSTYGYYIVIN